MDAYQYSACYVERTRYMYNAQANYNSGIAISPDGRHVYTTARGHDSIAGFAIGANGVLSPTSQGSVASGGRTPWSVTFASDTLLLVTNQNADDPAAREGGGPDADPCVIISLHVHDLL
jgi:6-phosphogluconolactonase (cycloisomerase 2 family)